MRAQARSSRGPRTASMLRSARRMKLSITMLLLAACVEPAEPGLLDFSDDGKSDGATAKLPSCVAEGSLFATMFEATRSTIDRGTVPAKYFASERNRADREMLLRGPE